MKPGFQEQLSSADLALAGVSLEAAAERRLQRRLGASMARRRMRVPNLVSFACACVVGALLTSVVHRLATPRELDGMRVSQASGDFASTSGAGQLVITAGAATLLDDTSGVALRVERPVSFKREARGMRVLRGEVEVQVSKRPASSPTRMLVSGGEIEVHGTRFHVTQRAAGGEVTLYEGAITFRCTDGREVEVHPGETLAWPLPPPPPKDADRVPPPPPAASSEDEALPPPRATPPPAAANDWTTHDQLLRAAVLLERVEKLRAEEKPKREPPSAAELAAPDEAASPAPAAPRRRHLVHDPSTTAEDQALKELDAAMTEDLPPAAREKLSFELGSMLTERWETERACRHWKDHLWRYPAGKYDEQVKAAQRELECR